jgi:hypothetical protein
MVGGDMSRLSRVTLALYTESLRLYPARFRAEFADEMQDVFGQAVQAVGDPLEMLILAAGEVRDLPLSIIREHMRERRMNQQLILQEQTMTQTFIPLRALKGLTWTLIVGFVLYCLLILAPFFYYGLNELSWNTLISGLYDPKGYLPFALNGMVGDGLQLLGIIVVILWPPTIVAMGAVLALTLRRHWGQLNQKQRYLGSAALFMAAFLLSMALSPIGRTLTVWFLD